MYGVNAPIFPPIPIGLLTVIVSVSSQNLNMSDSTASSLPVLAAIVEQDSPQIRSVKTALGSRADFEEELLKLREDNRSLQLRVLGVNELARLLQDRIEVIQVLQDKNKRLEVAVVRLENRCSNFERKLKSQGGAIGPKAGQSPFIPGPSRQILEALMKENSELKKTLNKVSKRGASGYLEAVVSWGHCTHGLMFTALDSLIYH